jgi:hypothetical protein
LSYILVIWALVIHMIEGLDYVELELVDMSIKVLIFNRYFSNYLYDNLK